MGKELLTKRENVVLQRAVYMQSAGKVVQQFIKLGWKSLPAIVALVQQHYPDITRDTVFNFWSYKTMNYDLLQKMETILEQLKAE